MREIIIGHKYRHFKENLYQVIDIVNDSESQDNENLKKSSNLYGAIWRTFKMGKIIWEFCKWSRS